MWRHTHHAVHTGWALKVLSLFIVYMGISVTQKWQNVSDVIMLYPPVANFLTYMCQNLWKMVGSREISCNNTQLYVSGLYGNNANYVWIRLRYCYCWIYPISPKLTVSLYHSTTLCNQTQYDRLSQQQLSFLTCKGNQLERYEASDLVS